MAAKLFIFGLPGSGKSEIARNIQIYVKQKLWFDTNRHWSTERFNDYPILDEMSKDKIEGKFFQRLKPGGFNVLNIEAFDMALPRLEQKIRNYMSSAKQEEIILIEFARNDYWRAFKQFDRTFLQDAYYIYLGAKVEVCKERISGRAANPQYEKDDYSVSEYIFKEYYYKDDAGALDTILQDVFGVDTQRMKLLDNNCSLEETLEEINPFIDLIIKRSTASYKEADVSPGISILPEAANQQTSSSEEDETLIEAKNYQLAH